MKINTTTVSVLYRLLCLTIIFSLPFNKVLGASPGYHFSGNRTSTQFSFQLVHNLIILPIKVNNDLTLRFILDSGTRTPIILNAATLKQLDLPQGRLVTFNGRGLEKVAKGYVVNNIKLQLPGVIATGISMVVLQEDYLKMKRFPVAVHGIIGYGLFSRFVVDIDYENLVIRLHDPATYSPGPLFNTLTLEMHDTKPYIKSFLTVSEGINIEAMLLIDTGAGTGLILETPSDPRIAARVNKKKKYIGRGLGGKMYCHLSQINRMQIGNYALTDVEAAFTGQKSLAHTSHGSIGGKVLTQFERVIFNYTNRQLYLKKKYPVNSLVMITEKTSINK